MNAQLLCAQSTPRQEGRGDGPLAQRCAVLLRERAALQSILDGKLAAMAEGLCARLKTVEDESALQAAVQLRQLLGATVTALRAPGGGA